MNNLIKLGQSLFQGFLSHPGDKIVAEVTRTGKQVIKASNTLHKVSMVRYPETGTIVKTEVYRED